jgi:hypothetical protein
MKLKTSDLEGVALDWAVAKCEGGGAAYVNTHSRGEVLMLSDDIHPWSRGDTWGPSYNWSQGGPIIERERIELDTCGSEWRAVSEITFQSNTPRYYGPTPLVAAMRCYVASTLGETVEVPDDIALDSMIYNTCNDE